MRSKDVSTLKEEVSDLDARLLTKNGENRVLKIQVQTLQQKLDEALTELEDT